MPTGSYVYRRMLRVQPNLHSPGVWLFASSAHERPTRK